MRTVTPPVYPRLGLNEVVSINGEKYRAEFWNSKTNPRYDFFYLGDNGNENFTRSEKDVSQAITEKKIKRL